MRRKVKNKNNIWYFGYVLSLLLIALIGFADLRTSINIWLSVLFLGVFGISLSKLLKQKLIGLGVDPKRNICDERFVTIVEKTGNITNTITVFLLGRALIIFFGLGYKIPAVIVGLIIAIQPLMIILVSNMIAKKYNRFWLY